MPGEEAGQVLAPEQLHRDERLVVGQPPEVEHLDDPDVADRARRLRLGEEPIDHGRIPGELRQQHLDRGGAAEHDVLGAIDHAHAALADLVEDLVLTDDAADQLSRIVPPRAGHRVGGLASRIAEPA